MACTPRSRSPCANCSISAQAHSGNRGVSSRWVGDSVETASSSSESSLAESTGEAPTLVQETGCQSSRSNCADGAGAAGSASPSVAHGHRLPRLATHSARSTSQARTSSESRASHQASDGENGGGRWEDIIVGVCSVRRKHFTTPDNPPHVPARVRRVSLSRALETPCVQSPYLLRSRARNVRGLGRVRQGETISRASRCIAYSV